MAGRAVHALTVQKAWRYLRAYWFDKKNHINTRSNVTRSLLDPINIHSLLHSTYYQPVPLSYLETLFSNLDEPPDTCFVDIGCGKGLACFYAAQRFKRVVGIDFSEKLIEQARQNNKSFVNSNGSSISFELRDARIYRLPEMASIVYLYNPFDHHILRDFLRANINHFVKHQSRIAYINDVCRDVLLEFGFQQDYRNPLDGIGIYSMSQRKGVRNVAPVA
ncbi:class I SAM-dependent methyltransferase [Noviherbaspirillum massiliense]|uniref:class I SAM-dependent methyltransferase n=1 Tax=Noviherbaspirillum massiliense TaxID=1465823 RepID=UPI0013758286|nr:class I SAM-dependent methyltransferase [Noviherbaspirillum massiliense]